MINELKIGDWVNSYSKGIYRIEKIFDRFYDESSPYIPENSRVGDKQNRIILSKRLLNSKFKKSLSYESCDEAFVSHLKEDELSDLFKVLSANSELINELNEFEIPTQISIYNIDLQIDNDNDLHTVDELIKYIKKGKSFLEILAEMKRLEILRLKAKYSGNYKFQLFNFNEEYIDKRQIWRDAELSKN